MEGRAELPRNTGMTPPSRMPDGRERSAEVIAYPVLYRRFLPRTLRWLRLYGVSRRHREDVAQEVWIRVLRTIADYDGARPFAPWLMTITFRTACDHRKRADIRRERLSESGEVDGLAPPAMEDDMFDATRTLEKLLPLLSTDHREVLIMVDVEEQSPSDVAEALGIPVNTVYSRLARARQEFEAVLRRFCVAERRRLGVTVLPAFLLDVRALFDAGREIPPVSVGTESRIWDGVQRGLQDLDGGSDGEPDPESPDAPAAPPRATLPPSETSGTPAPPSRLSLSRLPWSPSPVGLSAALALSGVGGAGLTYWWMHEPALPTAAIVQEQEPRSAALPSAPTSSSSAITPAAAGSVAPVDAGAPAYDSREELSALEAAYALYLQGKCKAARAKLGKHAGRVHAEDYRKLRAKIEACLAKDGGIP